MKKLLLVTIAVINTFFGYSQDRSEFCLTDFYYQKAIQNDPTILQKRAELERFTQQFVQNAQTRRTSGGALYIIPVVFHILHDYGPENISDAQIFDAMEVINRDFRKLNADTSATIPMFQGIAADCQIEFRLASIDPNGLCTNGIDRIQTTRTYAADDAAKLNPWPNNKYINIWVAKSLVNSGAAAYAYIPGTASNSVDGILSRYSYVGSIGQSSQTNARTLTHELGHVLNLYHTWGPGNSPGTACGDDQVGDTPQTQGYTACTLNGSVCNVPAIENVQNYMEYSYCTTMFTQGQAIRMQAALNSALSRRSSLWLPANLTATGTDGSPIQVCIPIADFTATNFTVCAGAPIQFIDQSWRAAISAWEWTFVGGSPAMTTDSSPVVTYAAAGVYPVTLRVTSTAGADSITKSAFIRVSANALDTVPFVNSFESPTDLLRADGYLVNPDNGFTWDIVTNAGSGGIASVRINNYNNTAGQIDEWISPSIDFSNVTLPTVSFKVSNAQRSTTSTDELKMFATSNCGQTWTQRWGKSGATLATAGVVTSSFSPTSSAQWRSESISMNPFALKPNVRIKFQNTSNRGNNTFVDEINITGNLVSIDEAEDVKTGFTIYPNPSTGSSNVSFYLAKNNQITLEIKDVLGKLAHQVISEQMPSGVHEIKLPELPSGIYLIDLSVGNKHHIRKLIIS